MGQSESSSSSSDDMETPNQQPIPEIKIDYTVDSPRFSVHHADELQQGVEYLEEHGYAVFSHVLTDGEINDGVNLFWKYLEDLTAPYHIKRDDPSTWSQAWPGMAHVGLLNGRGIGQSEFLWFIRGNPNVKHVFSRIWDSNELCVSFDGAGCFRDWRLNEQWKTSGAWYHCDQNPFSKPNRCSIQGLVSLTDNDESTGGLVIVPDSHKHFAEFKSIASQRRVHGDFVSAPKHYSFFQKSPPRLVKCKAGDLIVWDSRTIHCNTSALVDRAVTTASSDKSQLLRLVAYICMSPLSIFQPNPPEFEDLKAFRKLREDCVRNRTTCTHWPLEVIVSGDGKRDETKPLQLSAYQYSLVIGTDVDPTQTATTTF